MKKAQLVVGEHYAYRHPSGEPGPLEVLHEVPVLVAGNYERLLHQPATCLIRGMIADPEE